MVTKQILNKQITNKTAVLIFFISIEKKTNLIVNRSPIIILFLWAQNPYPAQVIYLKLKNQFFKNLTTNKPKIIFKTFQKKL